MRRPRLPQRPSGLMLASLLMALLLGVLAVLQYRWVGQLTTDERDRMQSHLTARAESLAADFNRELTRAYFWLQLGPELQRDARPQTDEERYAHWYAASPRPELIKTIYRVGLGEGAAPLVLEAFDRATSQLARVDVWPAALAPIRTRIEAELADRPRGEGAPPPVRIPLAWAEVPAIAVPRVQIVERAPNRIQATLGGPGGGYTIALLDAEYIRAELLPQLVERHFAPGQEPSLLVGIYASSGPLYVVPASDLPPALATRPDVKHDELFDLRLWERGRFVVERHAAPAPASGPGMAAAKPASPPAVVSVITRDDRRGGVFRGGGPGGGGGGPRAPHWAVHVLHRAGSLDIAVSQARTRNLLVSFGVLLMLGASMGMVLVATGRARRLAAQQMEFVAGVSHELRTPLAVIRSAAENLADGIVADPKQVRRYGEMITGEGRRLTQMVEQIMEFAGFESGRTTLEVRPADTGAIIEEALRAIEPHIREHGATIEQRLAAALPAVLVDPAAVSRSLQNLLVNALKYGGAPPSVRLEAAAGRPGEVVVSVADNGAGIAPRDLPHIFEPFYRGADATARQIHGSGLGLSLVKRIMQEVGGRVSVKTEAGRGSTFTLHLPVAPEGARESAGSTGALPDPHAPLSTR